MVKKSMIGAALETLNWIVSCRLNVPLLTGWRGALEGGEGVLDSIEMGVSRGVRVS